VDLLHERDAVVGEVAADGRADDDAVPVVGPVVAVLVPVMRVAEPRVVGPSMKRTAWSYPIPIISSSASVKTSAWPEDAAAAARRLRR